MLARESAAEWIILFQSVPTVILNALIFPVSVWMAALACGASRPTLSEAWREVWGEAPLLAAVVLLVGMLPALFSYWLRTYAFAANDVSVSLTLISSILPGALAGVAILCLAIATFRQLLSGGRDEVFR
jgi:hypothetical protein